MKKHIFSFINPLNVNKIAKKISKTKAKKMRWKTIANILLYGSLSFLFLTAVLFAYFSKDLPTPGKIKRRYVIQSSKILASDGKTSLYDISGDFRRTVIPKEEIPENLKNATVAIEDKDFYRHFGVDFRGIARAVYYDIIHKRALQGGSTITQQFVKNALLSPKKTYTRKIKELILALEIEMMYGKDDILAMYLNEIPYGSNAYGVEEASKLYFNKHAKDLTLSESATLAALTQAPTYYTNHKDYLQDRRNIVLLRMEKQHYINQEEYQAARLQPIKFVPRNENIRAPHFVMYVKEVLVQKYGEKMVEEGGLKVTTTLDLKKQEIAEKVVQSQKKHLLNYKAHNAGLVALDPKTGHVVAMVGSIDYFDTENDGNYNVTIANRQPGSSIKPLVYATAFEGKYNPGYVLYDLKTNFGNYTPHNYDGTTRGPVTIRYALGNSLNIPAVKMLGLVGIDKALNNMHEMGITTLQDRNRYGLSLVLGGGEVKPLDMATAYSVFANNGKLAKTTPILKVEDANGRVLEEYKKGKGEKQVLDPQAAYEINNVLSDLNAKRPTFSFAMNNLSLPDRPVAAKTGTTNGWRDAWTIGYTPSLVTAVWAGNNDNSPMTPSGGSIGAAPIWRSFMQQSLKGTKVEKFWRPREIRDVYVDKLSNKLPSKYSPQKIRDIFASWQVPTEYDDIHVSLAVCKDNGLLAPKDTPEEYIENKLFTNIHSEFPDKSNWENPVLAWARANGMSNLPPKQYCHISDIKPAIKITSPANNSNVSGVITIKASASFAGGIKRVEFLVDGVSIANASSTPYQTTYDVSQLSNGTHEISARAISKSGVSSRATINIKVGNDVTPPGDVTNIEGDSPSSTKVTLYWVNPSDSDLAKVKIYYSSSNLSIGSLKGEFPATPNSSQQITFTGLSSGTKCFTIRPVDQSGNERSTGTPQICL